MTSPTDLELMLLVDGELPAPRRAAVEAFLDSAEGAESRAKVAGLRAVSGILAEAGVEAWASENARTFDVADEVLRRLDEPEVERRPARPIAAIREVAIEPAAKAPAAKAPAAKDLAANDNGRLIFGLALGAAAAAAALFFWGKSPAPLEPLAALPAVSAPEVDPGLPRPFDPPGAPSGLAAGAPPEEDPTAGVEIASVDSGGRPWALYQGNGATVVWLSDD